MSAQLKQPRIIVGMSGGVDSSVTALLLQRQGYAVSGCFMKNWDAPDPDGHCPAERDALDALQVCEALGIELDAVNFAERYWDRVFRYFLDEYGRGRTPNPDILCNKEIKFRAFLDYALAQGAERIATGHYARIESRDGRYALCKARDRAKDQSYFLYALSQEQLSRALFPLGELHKGRVREIAMAEGFANHAKKDSTGICFIGERPFKAFLKEFLPARPGEIRCLDGERLGTHEGLMFYTIGQRKGLGIGGRREGNGDAWYVVRKDLEHNVLYVTQGGDDRRLYSRVLETDAIHWIAGEAPRLPLRCMAKTRYRQADQRCEVERVEGSAYRVRFDRPQWAVTAGQSVVFYDGETCLGGGVIERVEVASPCGAAATESACP